MISRHVCQASRSAAGANRLYSSWVTDISLDRLLETSDLDAPGISGTQIGAVLRRA